MMIFRKRTRVHYHGVFVYRSIYLFIALFNLCSISFYIIEIIKTINVKICVIKNILQLL